MPISQAEQKFLSMELQFRENLKELIDESAPRFSLDNLTYASFIAQFGYKTTVSADEWRGCDNVAEMVYVVEVASFNQECNDD